MNCQGGGPGVSGEDGGGKTKGSLPSRCNICPGLLVVPFTEREYKKTHFGGKS